MGLVPTSGCAHLSVRPGEAVEACRSDANGGTDLRSLDCGPGVHVRHIFQVPGTEADSVLTTKRFPVGGIPHQHGGAAWWWWGTPSLEQTASCEAYGGGSWLAAEQAPETN